jgi:hypothetical protein
MAADKGTLSSFPKLLSYYKARLGRVAIATELAIMLQMIGSGTNEFEMWRGPLAALVVCFGLVAWTHVDAIGRRMPFVECKAMGPATRRPYVLLFCVALPFGGATLALLWQFLFPEEGSHVVKGKPLSCFATLSIAMLFPDSNCINGNWFVGEYTMFVLVHPAVSHVLRLIETGTGVCGLLVVLIGLAGLGSTMWLLDKPTVSIYHSFAYPTGILLDYASFTVGATVTLLSQNLVRREPTLGAYPARSACETRPIVGFLGDVCLLGMFAFAIEEGYRCNVDIVAASQVDAYEAGNLTFPTIPLCEATAHTVPAQTAAFVHGLSANCGVCTHLTSH